MKIDMKHIRKSFGSNDVLKDVSFTVQGGEICALLGENGAGKSTLMNILGGVHQMDKGSIFVNGEEKFFTNPAQSQKEGIAFIHQELNLINDLPIYENMFLGREIKAKNGRLDLEKMILETQKMFEKMNVQLDPETMVETLDASYKQIIEICRAMMTNASIIIMDEPTTSLTEDEINRVFDMMKTLQQHNVGIVFISHKLNEVMQVCNKFAVLRDGNLVAEGNVQDVTTRELAKFMVGHDVRTERLSRDRELGDEVLGLAQFSHQHHFRDINLSVRAGEMVGVTGLLGDGRSDLFQSVFAAKRYSSGTMFLNGKKLHLKNTSEAILEGIAYLPNNRKENAIIKDMDIFEDGTITTWSKFSKRGVINTEKHKETFQTLRKTLRIKMGKLTDSINSLSGGNQQKVVLAKWLATDPLLLNLDNPTQGVDVGAKEEIYDIILKLAEENIAIVVLSGEAHEITRICDR